MVGNQAVGCFWEENKQTAAFQKSYFPYVFGVPVYSFHTLWDWHHAWVESKTQQLVWWFHVKDSQSYHWDIVAVNSDFEHFKLYSWSHSHKQLWPMAQNCGWQKIGISGFFQFPLVSFSAKYLQGPQKSHWEWNHNSGCRRSLQQQYTPTQHRPAPLIRKAAGSGMVIIKVQVVHSVGRKMIPYLIDFLVELNNI